MIRVNDIYMPLGFTQEQLLKKTAKELGVKPSDISELRLAKKSVDARKKNDVHFTVSVECAVPNEPALLAKFPPNKVSAVSRGTYDVCPAAKREHRPVVVGFGSAGMFAALVLAQAGLRPVVLERGNDVDKRTEDVISFTNGGKLNASSNVQFGEGGAGTFSDGKLTTGIRDRRISHIFRELVRFGAPEEILYLAKPHIGTDVLRNVVKALRTEVISLGGDVLFGARLTGLSRKDGRITGAVYEKDGIETEIVTDSVILAVGHSARDTFEYLRSLDIRLERKIFAMGVRIEHLRTDVDRSLYGSFAGHPDLPPAEYKYAVHTRDGRSLYTFCMCPGGRVIAAASEEGAAVTNGMSFHARDGENSNCALLVNVTPEDIAGDDPLAGMYLQRQTERAAFSAGGSDYSAPVLLAGDFIEGVVSHSFGRVKPSYTPGTSFSAFEGIFPGYILSALREGLPLLAKKASFFAEPEAVLTAPESRSSSPVRILRGEDMCSVSLRGLYPCGEGAGYAGGIVSAAVDGMKCAEKVIEDH